MVLGGPDRRNTWDKSSSARIDAGPTSSTSFGMKVEPPALPLRDDALVDNGAAAPKLFLSPVEIRTLTAAGGLLLAGTSSTTTSTIFPQPPLWFCLTEEEMNSRTTTIQYATAYSTFWKIKVMATKSRQTLVFDPGSCTGCLRACPFLGGRRALLCEEVFVWTLRWYPRLERVWYRKDLNIIFKRGQAIRYAV